MQITLMSFLSIIFYSAIFSFLLTLILQNVKLLRRIKCEVILICLAVPVVKMLVPMEVIPWTININVHGKLVDMIWYLNEFPSFIKGCTYSRWEIIMSIIGICSIFNFFRVAFGYWYFLHNMNQLPEYENPVIRTLVDQAMKEYGKDRFISIKRTDLVSAPSIVGIKKVMLLLPTAGLENVELKGIIRHEIVHYAYGDVVIQLVWSLVKALNWWNPVVYILNEQIVKVLEVRADEIAVGSLNDEETDAYRCALVMLSNLAGKHKSQKYCVSLFQKNGWLIKKRVKVLEVKYQRTHMNIIANYVGMTICVLITFFMMNCFIFEPLQGPPEDEYEKTQMVTADSFFLVRNPDGTFDMYMDGIYCATISEDMGSDIPIYDSLEEVMQYEENE